MTIGITGPSGAGKSVFCSILAERGWLWLDCDAIYHGLTDAPSPCTEELSRRGNFGKKILNADGSLNRRALAAKVFAPGAEKRLARLNRITHKYILAEVRMRRDAAEAAGAAGILIDAPLLFQAGFDAECDATVALLAPEEERVRRLCARDGLDEAAIRARLAAAPDDSFYTSRADFTVMNTGDLAALCREADRITADLSHPSDLSLPG